MSEVSEPRHGFLDSLLAGFVGASVPQARVVILFSIVVTQFVATFLAVGLFAWLQTAIVQDSYAASSRASEQRYARQRAYLDCKFKMPSAQCGPR